MLNILGNIVKDYFFILGNCIYLNMLNFVVKLNCCFKRNF